MMNVGERTVLDAEFTDADEMVQRMSVDPNLDLLETRELDGEPKAAAWGESGWPEQVDTWEDEQ